MNLLYNLNYLKKTAMSYDELVQKGILERQTGNREEAFKLFKEAIGVNPEKIEAYLEAGIESRELRQYDQANDFFNEALKIDPQNVTVLLNQAICNRLEKKYNEAIKNLEFLIGKDVKNVWTYHELVIVYRELKLFDQAKKYINDCLEIDPNFVPSYFQLGLCYKETNEYELALHYFESVLCRQPSNLWVYVEMSLIYRQLKDFSKAKKYLIDCLEIDPGFFQSRFQLGMCYKENNENELALECFRLVIEMQPSNFWAYVEIGNIYMALKEFENAKNYINDALKIDPSFTQGLFNLGLCYKETNEYDLALKYFEECIQKNKSSLWAYVNAGIVLEKLGRLKEAHEKINYAFVRLPFNGQIFERKISIQFKIDSIIAAHELFLYSNYHHSISESLVNLLFSSILAEQDVSKQVSEFEKDLLIPFLSLDAVVIKTIKLKMEHYDSFIALLTFLETVLNQLVDYSNKILLHTNIFLLLIIISYYKKNATVTSFVIENVRDYISKFSFNKICIATNSLVGITEEHFVLSILAKCAKEDYSIDCLLACLIMKDYYPNESCLDGFNNRNYLISLLPFFCLETNEATLKNIFIHLIRKQILTIDDIKSHYPAYEFVSQIESVIHELNSIYRLSTQRTYSKPDKLSVALCISGQLRGYEFAFMSIKKNIIDPLNPDVFVHVWQDVGSRAPSDPYFANRVFSGNFLQAYQNLFLLHGYTYNDIKKMMPSLFSLLNKNNEVNEKQLKEFYKTDFVVVEDDRLEPYSEFDNGQKMFYKINACNELVHKKKKNYDLIIRLRPDAEIRVLDNVNWLQVAEICNTKNSIFMDLSSQGKIHSFVEFSKGIYSLGDMVAIGSEEVMNIYSSLSIVSNAFDQNNLAHFNKSTHVLLAHGLWLNGICIETPCPFNIIKLHSSASSIKAQDILLAIQNDFDNIKEDIKEEIVASLLDSLALDIKQGELL